MATEITKVENDALATAVPLTQAEYDALPKEEAFSFSEALLRMRKGKNVRRQCWTDAARHWFIDQIGGATTICEVLTKNMAKKSLNAATLTPDLVLALDWVELGPIALPSPVLGVLWGTLDSDDDGWVDIVGVVDGTEVLVAQATDDEIAQHIVQMHAKQIGG